MTTRATTLQQKFGFQDKDLSTPAHDALMVWLDGNVEQALLQDYPQTWLQSEIDEAIAWAPRDCTWLPKDWQPEQPPQRPRKVWIKDKVWERPVFGRNGFMIGFVDMSVTLGYEKMVLTYGRYGSLPEWSAVNEEALYLFEVKPSIPSVGELIRQIRMYQPYLPGNYFVVSPDDRFASILAGQKIDFLKAPKP